MHVLHITPHLPPDQAANALLPFHLGQWAREAGDRVSYLANSARRVGPSTLPGPVTWIPRRQTDAVAGATRRRLSALGHSLRITRRALPLIRAADLVHVHSNGLLTEFGAQLAAWLRKPTVLTLYGTEVWHYRPRPVDLFARAYRQAAHVTFYSRGLLDRAEELGLKWRDASVIYPPVASAFDFHDDQGRVAARRALGLTQRHVLLNVKRLHPLAGQRYLIEAMPKVLRTYPDTRLIVCGSGPLLEELQQRAAVAGVAAHVVFPGQLDNDAIATYCAAADVFVLPSLLEACPTVALEALACGTPVISADNPGGRELHEIFGDDLRVVPRESGRALASATIDRLAHPRRTHETTAARIEQEFRPKTVHLRFRDVYRRAIETR